MSSKSRSSSKEKSSSSKKDKEKKKEKEEKREKKEKKEKKKDKKPKTPEPEPPEPEEQYDDDFEDYEDDFEDEDEVSEPKIEEKPKRTEPDEEPFESNILQRLATSHLRRTEAPKKAEKPTIPQPNPLPNYSAINNQPFSHDNYEERKSTEQRAFGRLAKLRGLITIETTKSTVFTDLSSNIFEPFQSISSNLAHAFAQTGKDSSSEEVQTEQAETEEKETQCPHLESRKREDQEGTDGTGERTPADRARLKKFFFAATQTIREILISDDKTVEENEVREKSSLNFSRGYNPFSLGAIVKRSKVTCIQQGESDSVLVAFEIFETAAADLVNKSLIAEFFVHKRRPPKRLFVVESVVSAMELSSATQTLYVCLVDGAFCAFDLSITDSFFKNPLPWVDSDVDIALRRPTFDSSFLATTISDATPLSAMVVTKSSVGEDITTIDTAGTISYWVCSRVEKNELRVLLAAVIRAHPVLKRHSNSFAVSAFCHTPKPLRFFIGTDTGMMYSVYKSDTSQAIPKIFNTEKEKYGEVTVISANPSDNTVLLVGFSSGSYSIYRTTQASALLNIPIPDVSTRVTWLTWSLTNPSGFYAIHNGNTIVFWDLGHKTAHRSTDLRTDSATILSACTWHSEQARIGYLAFGLDNGSSEVHVLEDPARKNANETILEVLRRL
ncbi:unnamed protein product [Caenorhabditis sp. 36 PRJEB53466]|nr:unnamed protein product [Caenorhabditis sp. 36 PRJEB53466]